MGKGSAMEEQQEIVKKKEEVIVIEKIINHSGSIKLRSSSQKIVLKGVIV